MALALSSVALGFAPSMNVRAPVVSTNTVRMETVADLEALAAKLNPTVKFWDPLGLATANPGGQALMGVSEDAAIGFLRHAEIKHGRVAMAAFVGFCVQSNGIHFPWASTLGGLTYADIAAAGGPASQWDALPTNAKWQIFGFIAMLEVWGESGMDKHYMSGGKPGEYPSFEPIRKEIGHPNLDLFDPFGLQSKMSPEKKSKGLLAEINNGRLAMIGIMAFVSEAKVPGAVPGLQGLNIAPYDGEVMAPWGPGDTAVPLVKEMLAYQLPWSA